MYIVNIHEAKTQFSKLIEAVTRGEEIVIAKAGKPAAKLVPFKEKKNRKFGVLKGQVRISEDFDEPLPAEVLEQFEDDI